MPAKPTSNETGASSAPIWMADKVIHTPVDELQAYDNNNRTHGAAGIGKLKQSVARFGFVTPILVDGNGVIIAGHGRLEAARALELTSVPTVVVDHLTPAEVRALRIADNRLAELSDWNRDALQIEFADLMELSLEEELEFDLDITGFEMPEIDIILGGTGEASGAAETETVHAPDYTAPAVTQPGDLWILGDHRVLCGDALAADSHDTVLDGELPRMVLTDPPYNVAVNGHVRSGNGGAHREFAMASGEMSETQFTDFLKRFINLLVARLPEGGVAMIFMDWRHIAELISAGKACGLEHINLCVWNKTNGGMGSLYRSKHELIAIFRKPGAAHVNNVELGKHGRNRTNVWDYAGVNSFGKERAADLVDHPTVKPTALVADAIMDVSHRGDIVLDCFGGSGATLLGAEKSGRRARLIELDPAYVDVAIRRWQEMTGRTAVHAASGDTFEAHRASMEPTEQKEAGHV